MGHLSRQTLLFVLPAAEIKPLLSIFRHDVTTPAGMRGYQVAWTYCKMIYSWVRNSTTSDSACLLLARQWDKFPWQGESMGVVQLSRLPPPQQLDTDTHTCTCRWCIGGNAGDAYVCVFVGVKLGLLIVSRLSDATSSWIQRTIRTPRTPENTVMVRQSLSTHIIICTSFTAATLLS